METVTFVTSADLTIEERLRLKERIADAYRAATETTAEIGVDRVETTALGTYYYVLTPDGRSIPVLAEPRHTFTRRANEALLEAATTGTRESGRSEVGEAPLTFEAMQADCAARGCSLERHAWITKPGVISNEHMDIDGGFDYLTDEMDVNDLARVDAWRRDLHISACPVCSPAQDEQPLTVRADELCADCQGQIAGRGDAFQYGREAVPDRMKA